MEFEPVIGLEIHIQLKTKTKMFCGCKIAVDEYQPNISVCPICLGHPGTLPAANRQAINFALELALALHFTIHRISTFARKHYFYPDLPKGYQITQYDEPLGTDGHLVVCIGKKRKHIRFERIHMEEDSAKLIHPAGHQASLVDFNRAGTPLLEIVTKPDIKNPQDARTFLQELRAIVRTLKISDGDMEKGHMRCDANISLRPTFKTRDLYAQKFPNVTLDKNLFPKTEIKNINSFRSLEHALQYEIHRQKGLWEKGEPPSVQSTRGWNDEQEETLEQRIKEESEDYRYLLEPDLPPVVVDENSLNELEAKLPELPDDTRKRFDEQYGLDPAVRDVLLAQKQAVEYFEFVASEITEWMKSNHHDKQTFDDHLHILTRTAGKWIVTKLFGAMHDQNLDFSNQKLTAENFAELMVLLHERQINSTTATTLVSDMVKTGNDPSTLVDERGLKQIEDTDSLAQLVQEVIDENQAKVTEYKNGKIVLLQYFIGLVMKKSKGKANPGTVKKMFLTFLR